MDKTSTTVSPKRLRRWSTYGRLLRYTRPYVGRLVTGGVCGILFAGSTVGFLPALNENFKQVFDYEHVNLFLMLLFPILALIRGAGEYLSSYLIQWVGNRVVMDLRVQAFTHLQDLSVGYFDQNKTGEMISRTVNDTTLMERAVSTVLTDLVRQPLVVVGAAGYLLWLDWKLAVVSFVLFPLCMAPVMLYGRTVRRAARQAQERLGDIVSIMQEAIVGVRIVKAFCMEQRERSRFSEQCLKFFGRVMRVVRARSIIEPIVVVISSVGIVLAFLYARTTRMPFENFMTFAIGLVALYEPVKKLGNIHMTIQQSSAGADRVFEVLDTESAVKDRVDATEFAEEIREIAFDNVGFSYGGEPVLKNISLQIKAGERVALVGSSGSGKTTLVNLLPRFFDVLDGRVLINGKDLRGLTLKSLRRRIGLVTQETFLFNDTIANNIRYGMPGASMEAVEKAARQAHAHEFIMEMQDKYDSVIGERGVRLSGGQRQRLAIARAVIANPPILIFDEATSALDTESERMVQAALDELMTGRTVFAIAHRLSTIAHCDRILVLEGGRIVEQGRHGELLAAGGVYKRLYDLQFELGTSRPAETA